MNEKQRDQIKN